MLVFRQGSIMMIHHFGGYGLKILNYIHIAFKSKPNYTPTRILTCFSYLAIWSLEQDFSLIFFSFDSLNACLIFSIRKVRS